MVLGMTRYLGIDYGSKRIGLAVGDDGARLASPVSTIAARGDVAADVRAVLAVGAEYVVDEFVVGLPLNMDDSEGPQARVARTFGAALEGASGRAVHYFDERLSSHAAEELLRNAELTRKKKKARLDRIAAQVMLQGFLDGGGAEAMG